MGERVRIKNKGLRGVIVADTRICFIDGIKGTLLFRGYRIEDLARNATFEEVLYLLLMGSLPRRDELDALLRELAEARHLPDFMVDFLQGLPKDADPLDVLMASIPVLGTVDPDLHSESRSAYQGMAIRAIARMPGVLAAWHRLRSGLAPIPPDLSLSHAEDFLFRFTGVRPDPEAARAFDVSMILQAEHGFNASTFACREVASTRAHLYAAVAAGVGALSGGLHGGANAGVVRMLLDHGRDWQSPDTIVRWVRDRLDRGKKIMGMGHAVYKTFDPRAGILRELAKGLGERTGYARWFQILSDLEAVCHEEFERRGKSTIKSNVDFYSGLLYLMLGIPVEYMTLLFALSLAAGWCAHIIEERFGDAQEKPSPYRPESEYIGYYCGETGCVYRPLDER